MADTWQLDADLKDLRGLVDRIRKGRCVLVLGPRVAIRADDPQRRPLDELLTEKILARLGNEGGAAAALPTNLRHAADLLYRKQQDRGELDALVQEVYAEPPDVTTDFHRNLAHVPFELVICATPDSLMVNAFREAGKQVQRGHYDFKARAEQRLTRPDADHPLVYHLFGHHEDAGSLVLTETDLVEFLVKIVRGQPQVPDQVRSILADRTASFLFLGFGFHNWYLRVLLEVLQVHRHESKAIAFEDEALFGQPEHRQAITYFTGDRMIDFRPLRWEEFARNLREAAQGAKPRKAAGAAPAAPRRGGSPKSKPTVFVSYASEDRTAVEALADQLEPHGLDVWQDKQDLRAGDNWDRVLLDVIKRQADYVVVVQTPAMTGAIEGVFNWEIAAAKERQSRMGETDGLKLRFLLPVRLGNCPLLGSLKDLHVIEVGTAEGVESLATSILEDWTRRQQMQGGSQGAA